MTQKDLLIMQSLAEFRKYLEHELAKAQKELSNGNESLYNYHYGKSDGLVLAIERFEYLNNLKK